MAFFAVTFGVIALLLAGGFMEWVYWATRQGAIEEQLGHIQITRPGYFERGFADPFAYLMPANTSIVDVVKHFPEVEVVTPRLAFNGLISLGDHTISFMGDGVVPATEARVSKGLTMLRGSRLTSAHKDQVLLGEGLARNLGASVNDRVVLMATKPNGGLNAIEVTVGGIFQTSSKTFDDYALRAPLALAQRLMNVTGVHSWVVLLKHTEQTDKVLRELKAKSADNEAAALTFTPWYKLADFYNKTVVLLSRQMNVLRGMIAVIVVLSISNTMIANVFERTGEIGTLLALGFRRRRIVDLFLGEGLLLGVFGGMAGLAIGEVLAKIISAFGIPMPPSPGMSAGFDAQILVTPGLAAGSFLLIIVTAVAASIYPAWRASSLVIVDALRHNR